MRCKSYCGAERFGKPGPFHFKPKAHAKEEEVPEDEWRESRFPECTAEDNPVLGMPKSQERKAPRRQGNPLKDPKRNSKPYGLAIEAW